MSDNQRQNYGPVDFAGNQSQYSGSPASIQMNNPDSNLAMVLGILSLVGTLLSCVCGCLGSVPAIVCGIIGLVISIRCRKVAKASGCSDGKATAGMVMSIIGLALCALSCIGSLSAGIWAFSTDLYS
jgi:hypothetical protein